MVEVALPVGFEDLVGFAEVVFAALVVLEVILCSFLGVSVVASL